MDNKKMTIIDFVEHYTQVFGNHVFLREKINNEWTETTFEQTREMAHRIGAGLMALGLEKGDKVALLSQGRNLWVTGELGILYAGGVNVPLSIKLTEAGDLLFRIQHSDAKYILRILGNCCSDAMIYLASECWMRNSRSPASVNLILSGTFTPPAYKIPNSPVTHKLRP